MYGEFIYLYIGCLKFHNLHVYNANSTSIKSSFLTLQCAILGLRQSFRYLMFTHVCSHGMYRINVKMFIIFLPITCKHGKCSSFTFTLAEIDTFANPLYPYLVWNYFETSIPFSN
jgi:hypothetical protein